MIDLTEKQKKIISEIFHKLAADYEIRAYGSRVNGTAHAGSDLDLVILGKEKVDWQLMGALKEAFEESYLPFRVDILDWNRIPESFKKNIEKEYVVLLDVEEEKRQIPEGGKRVG